MPFFSSLAMERFDVASSKAQMIAWSISCMGSMASLTFWDRFLMSPTPIMTGVIRPGTIFRERSDKKIECVLSKGNFVQVEEAAIAREAD